MSFHDYKVLLYRNHSDGWVAEIPAIPGCHALMATREEVLAELASVFQMISDEYAVEGRTTSAGNILTDAQRRSPTHGGREIGPPLFYRILQQLGLTPDEFERLR